MLDFDYLYTISDMLVVVCIYYGVPVVLSNTPKKLPGMIQYEDQEDIAGFFAGMCT